MRTYVFLDLDDTLFQTRRKCPAGRPTHRAARLRDGTPNSFMTPRQQAMLKLWRQAEVIPVTARNRDAFSRVEIKFDHYAVLNFGGVVLRPDGGLDDAWDEQIRPQTLEIGPTLREVSHLMESFVKSANLNVRTRLVEDFDMPLYLVAKDRCHDARPLREIADRLLSQIDLSTFFVHRNDNNLSVVPRFLGKEKAVRWVIDERLGPEPALTIGVGDSRTDLPFMKECDLAVFPTRSQIAQSLYPQRTTT